MMHHILSVRKALPWTFFLMALSGVACHAIPQDRVSPKATLPSTSSSPEGESFSSLSHLEKSFASVGYEDQMEFRLKKRVAQNPEWKFLLAQKPKFHKMGTACDLDHSKAEERVIPSDLYDFVGPYQVTAEDFLVIGSCSFNTTYITRNTVVFHYNTRTGINPIPLQMAQPTPTNPGENSHYFGESPRFNQQTRELTYTLPCTYKLLDRDKASPRQYVYRLEQGNLILQKAIWDYRTTCKAPEQWVQIYP
jgi:hypothetical protein